MKYLLLLPLLAACTPYVDPCYTNKENPHCVEMDRSGRVIVVDFDFGNNPPHNVDDGDNGAGSASSDVNHDSDGDDSHDSGDSNGDGSDEWARREAASAGW